MSSIIVIIPYLLALTFNIVSSNIYTRLAVCNCLSFTWRWGDSPSLLMAIFITGSGLNLITECIFRPVDWFLSSDVLFHMLVTHLL